MVARAFVDDCIARLKHYRSLVPMAQEAHKPIFHLTTADGAIGNHAQAVEIARLPEQIKGYGHVKARNLAAVRPQWQALLAQWRGEVALQKVA